MKHYTSGSVSFGDAIYSVQKYAITWIFSYVLTKLKRRFNSVCKETEVNGRPVVSSSGN